MPRTLQRLEDGMVVSVSEVCISLEAHLTVPIVQVHAFLNRTQYWQFVEQFNANLVRNIRTCM